MALSLVHAFSPPCHLAGLGRGSSLAGRVRGSASAAHMQRRRASSSGVLCLRAVDMSLAVSDTPPEEDPLADIPAIKMHTADGPVMCLPEEWNKSGVYCCYDKEGAIQYVAMSRKVQVSIENHLQLIGEDQFAVCKARTWDKPSKEDLESTATQWIQYCIDLTGGAPPGNTREVDIWRAKAADLRRGKANVEFATGVGEDKAENEITRLIALHPVLLFIKGTRQSPQCGFTDATVALFDQLEVDYECIDTLDEEHNPGLREGIKTFSVWPTIPQVYVGGEFIGGADVCRELAESGELQETIMEVLATKRRTMSI